MSETCQLENQGLDLDIYPYKVLTIEKKTLSFVEKVINTEKHLLIINHSLGPGMAQGSLSSRKWT